MSAYICKLFNANVPNTDALRTATLTVFMHERDLPLRDGSSTAMVSAGMLEKGKAVKQNRKGGAQ